MYFNNHSSINEEVVGLRGKTSELTEQLTEQAAKLEKFARTQQELDMMKRQLFALRDGKARGVDKKIQTEAERGKRRMRDTQTEHTGPISSPSQSPVYSPNVPSPREERKGKSKNISPPPDAAFIPAYSGHTSAKHSGATSKSGNSPPRQKQQVSSTQV